MRVLIVEDQKRLLQNFEKMLKPQGFNCVLCQDAQEAKYNIDTESFDVIVLDWMLGDESGLDICSYIRAQGLKTPVMMLTAKSQVEDKVEALNTGADDYLTKPFAAEEFVARLKALTRRSTGSVQPEIKIGNLVVNTNTRQVSVGDSLLRLSPREYLLLEYMALNECKALDRETLLTHVWGDDLDILSNKVDVHIRYLRMKLGVCGCSEFIKTIKGKGYMLCKD